MARTRATIYCSIHSDRDWLDLSPAAKLTYLTVTSQASVSLAGCLDYHPEKWARLTGHDVDATARAVAELIEGRFLIIDDDTFECVIRSFVRRDVGPRANKKVVSGVWSAWSVILSPTLRQVVLDEMPEEIRATRPESADPDTDDPPMQPHGTAEASTERSTERSTEPSTDRTVNRSTSSSSSPGTVSKTHSLKSTANPTPHRPPGSPPTAAQHPTLNDRWERFWRTYPRRVGKKAARAAWDRARKTRNPDTIQAALEASLSAWSTMDEQFIPHPATWLNQGRYDDPPPRPRPGSAVAAMSNREKIAASIGRLEATR